MTNFETLWNSLRKVEDVFGCDLNHTYNSDEYRVDDIGVLVKKSEHGTDNEFAWSFDHIFPISKGGKDIIENIQILNKKNNDAKGNDFPTYSASVISVVIDGEIRNIEHSSPRISVTNKFISELTPNNPEVAGYHYPISIRDIDNRFFGDWS